MASRSSVGSTTTSTMRPAATSCATSPVPSSSSTESAAASARCQRSPWPMEADWSRTMTCSRAVSVTRFWTAPSSAGPANASASRNSTPMRRASRSRYWSFFARTRRGSPGSRNITELNTCLFGLVDESRCSQTGTPMASRPSRNAGASSVIVGAPVGTAGSCAARLPASRRCSPVRGRCPRPRRSSPVPRYVRESAPGIANA